MKKDFQLRYGPNTEDRTIYRVRGTPECFCITGSPMDRGWRTNNEEFLRLIDNGDGIDISFDGGEPIRFDYCQAEQLRLALKINNPKCELSEIEEKPFEGLESKTKS